MCYPLLYASVCLPRTYHLERFRRTLNARPDLGPFLHLSHDPPTRRTLIRLHLDFRPAHDLLPLLRGHLAAQVHQALLLNAQRSTFPHTGGRDQDPRRRHRARPTEAQAHHARGASSACYSPFPLALTQRLTRERVVGQIDPGLHDEQGYYIDARVDRWCDLSELQSLALVGMEALNNIPLGHPLPHLQELHLLHHEDDMDPSVRLSSPW